MTTVCCMQVTAQQSMLGVAQVTDDYRIKITDFGMARAKAFVKKGSDQQTAIMTECGTPFWSAPRTLHNNHTHETPRFESHNRCVYVLESLAPQYLRFNHGRASGERLLRWDLKLSLRRP